MRKFLVLLVALAVVGCGSVEIKNQVDVGKTFLSVGDDFNLMCPLNKIPATTCADFKKFAPDFKATYPNYTTLQKSQLDAFKQAADKAKGGQ